MQKHVNLVDLVKSFPTSIYLQNLASIQKRTSPVKFPRLAEKSGKGSISNLSTKVLAALQHALGDRRADAEGRAVSRRLAGAPGHSAPSRPHFSKLALLIVGRSSS